MAQTHGGYYVPHGSYWPMVGSVGLSSTLIGFAAYLENQSWGPWLGLAGVAIMIFMLAGWFGTVIRESVGGFYKEQEDRSFRWGMTWFIFSEVMFFGAFFGALFYVRMFSVPWLGGEHALTSQYIWNGVSLAWPTAGPGFTGMHFEAMKPWLLPTLNTLILLTSSVTVTIAHHALKENHRGKLILGLLATVILGFSFVYLQSQEYLEAYTHMNLTLHTGIYGSTFFMLTGFHGLHVTIGAITLTVMLFRVLKGHFTPDDHFGFEAAAWYWHFVDVVWLGLYVFVYLLA